MIWEKNYKRGRYNNYAFDRVITLVLQTYSKRVDKKKIKILDLGCGGGGNTKFLYNEGFNTWAVDASIKAINITKKKINNKIIKKQIIKASFKSLPFKNNFFNFILDRQSLGHNLKKDILKSVPEIYRTLKKGGYLLSFVFSNKHPHIKYGKRFIKEHKYDLHRFKKGIFKNSGITHFFSLSEIKSIFKKFRFIEVVRETDTPLVNDRLSKYNNESFMLFLQKNK